MKDNLKRLIPIILFFLLLFYLGSTQAQTSQVDYFPRGTISASYCKGLDSYNYTSLEANYYVYYLTFGPYPISYLDVFGGVSYKFEDPTPEQGEFGYTIGLSWTFLFVAARPTYNNQYVLYRNFDTCYVYFGVNYPIWWNTGVK